MALLYRLFPVYNAFDELQSSIRSVDQHQHDSLIEEFSEFERAFLKFMKFAEEYSQG